MKKTTWGQGCGVHSATLPFLMAPQIDGQREITASAFRTELPRSRTPYSAFHLMLPERRNMRKSEPEGISRNECPGEIKGGKPAFTAVCGNFRNRHGGSLRNRKSATWKSPASQNRGSIVFHVFPSPETQAGIRIIPCLPHGKTAFPTFIAPSSCPCSVPHGERKRIMSAHLHDFRHANRALPPAGFRLLPGSLSGDYALSCAACCDLLQHCLRKEVLNPAGPTVRTFLKIRPLPL